VLPAESFSKLDHLIRWNGQIRLGLSFVLIRRNCDVRNVVLFAHTAWPMWPTQLRQTERTSNTRTEKAQKTDLQTIDRLSLAGMFFDDRSGVLVITQINKFRVSQMIAVRSFEIFDSRYKFR
jgi:hypothetical protein